jgi:uncharacterized membrane protein
MKKLFTLFPLLAASKGFACTTCNKSLQEAIFDSTFYPNLFTMLLAFIVIGVIVVLLAVLANKRESKRLAYQQTSITAVPLFSASTILGIGIGGIIDGTFLHQILQWHEMLSNKIPPVTLLSKSVNMFWDGIFHAFCLIVIIAGLYMLFRLFYRKDVIINAGIFNGGLLFGWGLFNVMEGIIDHQILKLHNVREVAVNITLWNYGFLAFSVVLMIIGWLLFRRGSHDRYYTKTDR